MLLTLDGIPKQNGLAEPTSRTILERLRFVLLEYGLPKILWGDIVATRTYMINKCLSKRINFKGPMKLWSGK